MSFRTILGSIAFASLAAPSPVIAKNFSECETEANSNQSLVEKINKIPQDNTNMLLRGAIVGINSQIAAYSKCLPDPRAQNIVNQYTTQRNQALDACRTISATDNCLVPPF